MDGTRTVPVHPTLVPGKDATFGTSAVVKTFYEGRNSGMGHYDWVETPPKQLNKKLARAYDRVAIRVYKVKDPEQPTISGRTPLKMHMIELQSPLLIAALKDIVKEENVFLEATEIAKFDAPFRPLFFCYDKISSLHRNCDDFILKQHLALLMSVMTEIFGGFMTHLKSLQASKLISYKLAWTYFPRNSIVFANTEDCERLCRVVDTQYQMKPQPQMNVLCEELRFDGDSYTWKNVMLEVPAFAGNLPVNVLPCYPLEFHEDQDGVKARLIARGKKVLDYQELTYVEYSGIGTFKKGMENKKHYVSRHQACRNKACLNA